MDHYGFPTVNRSIRQRVLEEIACKLRGNRYTELGFGNFLKTTLSFTRQCPENGVVELVLIGHEVLDATSVSRCWVCNAL